LKGTNVEPMGKKEHGTKKAVQHAKGKGDI
jgi:hypothetical protein